MSSEPKIRVLAADDQRVVREGLAMLLGLLPDVEVAGTAADGEEVLVLAAQLKPDVILMDLRMPRMDGVEATRRLRERDPEVKVVVLTTYADDRSVIDALRAAALAERQRLARDMHDVLAHSLSGLLLQLEGARLLAVSDPGDERLAGTIDRAHELARSGLDEARRAIGMLRDDELPAARRRGGRHRGGRRGGAGPGGRAETRRDPDGLADAPDGRGGGHPPAAGA